MVGTPVQGGVPMSADQSCPACHALGHAALAPAASAVPEPIAWSVPVLPAPRSPMAYPAAARAPPQQPRAPPALSV